MMTEEKILEKWRSLPTEKQQEVADFLDLLSSKNQLQTKEESPFKQKDKNQKSKLGERLQQVRVKIVASGIPLLSEEEIEKEKAKRRGGYWRD